MQRQSQRDKRRQNPGVDRVTKLAVHLQLHESCSVHRSGDHGVRKQGCAFKVVVVFFCHV